MDHDGEERLRQFLQAAIERRRPGLSSRELARRCERYGFKVNESYVSQFLSGARHSVSFKALRPISNVLGVSYLHLLLLAGYISEDDLRTAESLGFGSNGRSAGKLVGLDLNILSNTGQQLMIDYYELIRTRYPREGDQN